MGSNGLCSNRSICYPVFSPSKAPPLERCVFLCVAAGEVGRDNGPRIGGCSINTDGETAKRVTFGEWVGNVGGFTVHNVAFSQ